MTAPGAPLPIPVIAQSARNAGIPPGAPLYTAVAIAMAESYDGDPRAVSKPNADGSVDYGLWQINSQHADLMPGADRLDPQVSAQLMAQLSYGGTNWTPWTTYTSGAYLTKMPAVMAALAGKTIDPAPITSSPAGARQAGLLDQFSALDTVFTFLTTTAGWVRIIKVAGGSLLVVMGGWSIVKQTDAYASLQATAAGAGKVAAMIPKVPV